MTEGEGAYLSHSKENPNSLSGVHSTDIRMKGWGKIRLNKEPSKSSTLCPWML